MLTKKQKTFNWVLAVFLLLLSIFFLFPVIWMLANSFKPDAAITADMNSVAAFIPPALNGNYFENYITILTDTNFLRYMLNTLVICGTFDRTRRDRQRACRLCTGKD